MIGPSQLLISVFPTTVKYSESKQYTLHDFVFQILDSRAPIWVCEGMGIQRKAFKRTEFFFPPKIFRKDVSWKSVNQNPIELHGRYHLPKMVSLK